MGRAAFVFVGALMAGCASISGLDELVVSGDSGTSSSSGGTSSSSGGTDAGDGDGAGGGLKCGVNTCNVGQVCCIANGGARFSCGGGCGPHDTSIACGSSSECTSGEICCAHTSPNGTLRVSCAADCSQGQEICTLSGPEPWPGGCSSGSTCYPGGPISGAGSAYGTCQ